MMYRDHHNAATDSSSGSGITSVVSYTLPAGWSDAVCTASNVVLVTPTGAPQANCGDVSSSPITISMDANNTNNCNELQNVQNDSDHVCKSLYINGHLSLDASTTYDAASSYKTSTTFSDYFINTGKGIVKVDYTYTSNNSFQAGFDQLATSIKTK
jgi:hypothetical protein